MNKIIKVEVLIATPPTSKCLETIEVLEELVRRHPDEVQLAVFKRGVDFLPPELALEAQEAPPDSLPREASIQIRMLINKNCAVPSCVVDGVLFSSLEVPVLQKLEDRVQEILRQSSAG